MVVDVDIFLSRLHSCVEIVMSGSWNIGEICQVSLTCGGLKCTVIILL